MTTLIIVWDADLQSTIPLYSFSLPQGMAVPNVGEKFGVTYFDEAGSAPVMMYPIQDAFVVTRSFAYRISSKDPMLVEQLRVDLKVCFCRENPS